VERTGEKVVGNLDKWAREEAAHNLRKPTLETSLRRWWVKKYRLPWTHECAQDSTIEELLVEYYEDFFEEHPNEARKELTVNGEFIFSDTGDPLLDKWERELSEGLSPDLEEGLPIGVREELKKERESLKRARKAAAEFDKVTDKRLESKFATPGSKEEKQMLQKKVLGHGANEDWIDMLGND
jgi:hypothetical protein